MKLIKVKDYSQMTEVLLGMVCDQIKKKPESVISFTTGATPKGMLLGLADEVNNGLDISRSVFCNLDEYVGKKDAVYSVWHFMHECLYDRIEVKPAQIHMMDAEAVDQEEELLRYGRILKEHPRDIQILGLGVNGHIGANEPGTPFDSQLFVSDSRESTRTSTRELFHLTEEETPHQMFTMGFEEIMAAECVVLAASGRSKASAVKLLLEGDVTTEVPATCLRNHPCAVLIVDEEAASLLQEV